MNASGLVPAVPPLDPATAGTAPIPSSLDVLEDRDLAQRLATSVFGIEAAVGAEPDPNAGIEVIEQVTIQAPHAHTVVWVKISGTSVYDKQFEYHDLRCSHDMIWLPDDEQRDVDGNPLVTGRMRDGRDVMCPAKSAAVHLRRTQVLETYRADPNLWDPSWPGWRERDEPLLI